MGAPAEGDETPDQRSRRAPVLSRIISRDRVSATSSDHVRVTAHMPIPRAARGGCAGVRIVRVCQEHLASRLAHYTSMTHVSFTPGRLVTTRTGLLM
jgi:hypothetical protein